jgi:hypothetical protein
MAPESRALLVKAVARVGIPRSASLVANLGMRLGIAEVAIRKRTPRRSAPLVANLVMRLRIAEVARRRQGTRR